MEKQLRHQQALDSTRSVLAIPYSLTSIAKRAFRQPHYVRVQTYKGKPGIFKRTYGLKFDTFIARRRPSDDLNCDHFIIVVAPSQLDSNKNIVCLTVFFDDKWDIPENYVSTMSDVAAIWNDRSLVKHAAMLYSPTLENKYLDLRPTSLTKEYTQCEIPNCEGCLERIQERRRNTVSNESREEEKEEEKETETSK